MCKEVCGTDHPSLLPIYKGATVAHVALHYLFPTLSQHVFVCHSHCVYTFSRSENQQPPLREHVDLAMFLVVVVFFSFDMRHRHRMCVFVFAYVCVCVCAHVCSGSVCWKSIFISFLEGTSIDAIVIYTIIPYHLSTHSTRTHTHPYIRADVICRRRWMKCLMVHTHILVVSYSPIHLRCVRACVSMSMCVCVCVERASKWVLMSLCWKHCVQTQTKHIIFPNFVYTFCFYVCLTMLFVFISHSPIFRNINAHAHMYARARTLLWTTDHSWILPAEEKQTPSFSLIYFALCIVYYTNVSLVRPRNTHKSSNQRCGR